MGSWRPFCCKQSSQCFMRRQGDLHGSSGGAGAAPAGGVLPASSGCAAPVPQSPGPAGGCGRHQLPGHRSPGLALLLPCTRSSYYLRACLQSRPRGLVGEVSMHSSPVHLTGGWHGHALACCISLASNWLVAAAQSTPLATCWCTLLGRRLAVSLPWQSAGPAQHSLNATLGHVTAQAPCTEPCK